VALRGVEQAHDGAGELVAARPEHVADHPRRAGSAVFWQMR
jgi:hypothetical protein